MKKMVLLLLLLPSFGFSQIANVEPTTEEEYNYVTKGYKVQIESGLDMKKGYLIKDMGEKSTVGKYYTFEFKLLIREASKSVAAIMVKVNSSISSKTYYLCIPQGNQELMNRFWKELDNWDGDINRALAKLTSVYMTAFIVAGVEMENKAKK